MASNLDAKTLSAKNARIMVSGVILGYAQGITHNEDYGTQDVVAVGSFEVLEHQHTIYRGSGSIQKWRLREEIVTELRKVSPDDVLRGKTVDIEIFDEVSGNPIKILEGVTFGGRGGGVNAGQLLQENVSFRYIRSRE